MAFAGGMAGALFFVWIFGTRILNPTQINWVMQLDWRIHFFGWHFFRREPWLWPPGRIAGYFHAPDGTAIGFTDSIPLVALLLKPFSTLLPDPFQYLGIWLLLCFALQGTFGVLLVRIWTPHRSLQLLAAAFFVLMPTLLIRVDHPALCAHWVLLWAMWLYFRTATPTRACVVEQIILGLVAGLLHPYLAVMVLAILLGAAIKWRAMAGLGAAVVAVVTGWWAAGLFTVTGADNLGADGLGYFSMNLLAIVTPSGWSMLLPDRAIGSPGQTYEGFQYLGAGTLLVLIAAVVLQFRGNRSSSVSHVWPIASVAAVCAVYALSPRVTVFDTVLADFSGPGLERLGIFRATGRFFWPMAYLLLIVGLGTVVSRLTPRPALVMLCAALCVQLVDLSPAHSARRASSRSSTFHEHALRLQSPFWPTVLPHYAHLVMVMPPQCGPSPLGFEWPAYLAGLHGLTINAGEVARRDAAKVRNYCAALAEDIRQGRVADDTIYLVDTSLLEPIREHASRPLRCGNADGVAVCVTEASYQRWAANVRWP